jgi:hypothetical protein
MQEVWDAGCLRVGSALIVVGRGKSSMSISSVLAILALVIALVNAVSGKAPLWIAVALLALAMILPGLPLKM